jgi:hypothetical protein
MSEAAPATQYAANQALEKSEDNGESISDIRKHLTALSDEVRVLNAFNSGSWNCESPT